MFELNSCELCEVKLEKEELIEHMRQTRSLFGVYTFIAIINTGRFDVQFEEMRYNVQVLL